MKVYVVMTGDSESGWVEGVYLSREAADNRMARVQRNRECEGRVRYNGETHDHAFDAWTNVKEWEVRDGARLREGVRG